MDQLDLLKQNWKNREQNHPQLSYTQIYNMLFKRSTSIVKWIFIISLFELLFWVGLYFISPKSSIVIIEKLGLTPFMIGFNILHYVVVVTFIIIFYKNYIAIKVTDSTRSLMDKILKTRRTVKYFVWYNVSAFAVVIVIINYFYYTKSDILLEAMAETYGPIPEGPEFLTIFFITQIVFGIILILLLILFYRIVYGILLKKLYNNYHELKKIEV